MKNRAIAQNDLFAPLLQELQMTPGTLHDKGWLMGLR